LEHSALDGSVTGPVHMGSSLFDGCRAVRCILVCQVLRGPTPFQTKNQSCAARHATCCTKAPRIRVDSRQDPMMTRLIAILILLLPAHAANAVTIKMQTASRGDEYDYVPTPNPGPVALSLTD